LAGVAENPQLIRDVFGFTDTTDKNAAGIHGVRFFIRGKPWVVDVDDTLVWADGYADSADSGSVGLPAGLPFVKPFDTTGDMWAAVLEKAWGKVKGDITMAGQGGYVSTGLRALVGSPSLMYYPETADLEDAYTMIMEANDAGYLMGSGTAGSGNDQETNACGIAMSHAYSLIAPFEMTDANGTVHKMLMFRNPWGTTNYSGTWSAADANWTDDLVAQVPHSIDPRTDSAADGVFVTPLAAVDTAEGAGGCFSDLVINHHRDDEGYTDEWYDATDDDGAKHSYKFTVPADATVDPADSIYVTVEGYYSEVIPMHCFE
jgi:hypothetical protein